MIKKFTYLLLALFSAMLVVSCKKDEPAPPLPPANYRTIIVYMMGDNSLSSYNFDVLNIDDMQVAMRDIKEGGRLLILYHTNKKEDVYLLEVAHRNETDVEVDTLKRYDNFVTTNPDDMRRAINDIQTIAPAPEYGLIFWSHASGWLPQNKFYVTKAPSSIGQEGVDKLTIDIDVLANALSPFHFDFILFDACLMGSIEVAYQLRNVCDHIIASPTEALGAGYPYRTVIPLMFTPTVNYDAISNEYYLEYIAPSNGLGTIAHIDISHIEEVTEICRDIVKGREDEIAQIDTHYIQYYDRRTPHVSYDLRHYMQQLANENQLAQLDEALNRLIPYKRTSSKFLGITINHFSGLSAYIPQSCGDEEVENFYQTLDWYRHVYQ